jgi:cellulose synthase/poly-beta-1,6-N-acetylglucosamine synthase-like glycosyltransferase
MHQILLFLAAATVTSLLWLFAGGRLDGVLGAGIGRRRAAWVLATAATSAVAYLLLGYAFNLLIPEQSLIPLPDVTIALVLGAAYAAVVYALGWVLPDWHSRGHAFLVAFGAAQALFLIQIAWTIATAGLAPLPLLLSILLFAGELFAVTLTLYFAFEVLDVAARARWERYFPPFSGPNDYWPKVSVHVPAHAEPPEMVIETLAALRALDYPSYEVIMVDDNTDEDELWRPVLDYCQRHGIKVFHLQNYPGFKSGALNFALTQTAPDAEIIAVVDSDYVVKPEFLRETVPYFSNPRVAFVQTPQSFRNDDANLFARFSALAQRFFFEISMRSRNERNAIIFAGTMGLLRKRALERVGGWDEWCITEDALTSLRLLQKGYESVYINEVYGQGLLPETFEDTKKQRYRWAFGGMQILRRHGRDLLPLPGRAAGDQLTGAQRLSYLFGLSGWLMDLLVLFFTVFLLVTGAAYLLGADLPVRQLAAWILLVPLLSIGTGVLRVAWALRRATGVSWREGVGAFTAMLSYSLTVARATLAAMRHSEGVFLRTPKFATRSSLTRALRAASGEALLATVLLAAAPLVLYYTDDPEGLLLALLLAWHGLVYLAALRAALLEAMPVGATAPRSMRAADEAAMLPAVEPVVPQGD